MVLYVGGTQLTQGKLLNLVQNDTTGQTGVTSESFTAGNLSASITPSATNSGILVIANFRTHTYQSSGTACYHRCAIYRQINSGGYSLSYPASVNITNGYSDGEAKERAAYQQMCFAYKDAPGTTNQVDYKVYLRRDTSSSGTANFGGSSHQCTMTLLEIAGAG